MISLKRLLSFRNTRLQPNPRAAFSLLELMLALGLLGALLAVAWSLLGTYRNAEVRGWKLSYRVQTVRSARAWLEWDAQHLIISSESSGPTPVSPSANRPAPLISRSGPSPRSGPSSSPGQGPSAIQSAKTHRFTGTALGFSATLAPSIDPIPFLENLMSDAASLDRDSSRAESSGLESLLGQDPNGNAMSDSPWPAETIDIEYRLTPMSSQSASSDSPSLNLAMENERDTTQYVLSRLETISSPSQTTAANPSERTLSAQDLYRQGDEGLLDGDASYRETRLEGLTRVQFRYFDGTSWKSNWNSDQQGGLPCGIALGFDFPANSEIQLPATEDTQPTDDERLMSEQRTSTEPLFAEAALAIEPLAESSTASSQSIMESSSSEIQIVVLVTNGVFKSTGTAASSMQRVRP